MSAGTKAIPWIAGTVVSQLACPTGIEPVTPSLEGWCSIQLSYGQRGPGKCTRHPVTAQDMVSLACRQRQGAGTSSKIDA